MKNVTLVGMPASGKSTAGVLLAKRLGFSFIDVDLLIQEREGRLLKDIIKEEGLSRFLEIEDQINCSINTERAVIAPGGSVIYGEKAMNHLKKIGLVVYIKISYDSLLKRLGDLIDRGVALKDGMTLMELYEERTPLYEKYADITIEADEKSVGKLVDELREMIEKEYDLPNKR